MQLHVFDNEQQIGPFPKEAVRDMLQTGAISPNAHVWHDGAPDWIPVQTYFAQQTTVRARPGPVHPPTAAMGNFGSPSKESVFLKAALAGLGIAVLGGIVWAVFQIFVPVVQLAFLFGVITTLASCSTVDKISGGSSGALYLLVNVACVFLIWLIGIFGVLVAGKVPFISIYTIAAFVFALVIAWWKANN